MLSSPVRSLVGDGENLGLKIDGPNIIGVCCCEFVIFQFYISRCSLAEHPQPSKHVRLFEHIAWVDEVLRGRRLITWRKFETTLRKP